MPEKKGMSLGKKEKPDHRFRKVISEHREKMADQKKGRVEKRRQTWGGERLPRGPGIKRPLGRTTNASKGGVRGTNIFGRK